MIVCVKSGFFDYGLIVGFYGTYVSLNDAHSIVGDVSSSESIGR